MGFKNIISKGKEIKGQADSQKKENNLKKQIEKETKKFESKKDKELNKLKQVEAYQMTVKKDRPYKAYVVVNLVNGTLTEEIAVLGAEIGYKNEQPVLRVKDKEENIIFEEPKPDAVDEFNFTDKDTVKKQIEDCEKALKNIQSRTKSEVDGLYESDWLEQLRYWKARETHINLGEKGSYMKIRNGAPHYEFDLVGYFKIPVYRYTSKSTISIPPLGKIITGQVLMKKLRDEVNADQRDAQKLMNTIYGILLFIAVIGSLILMYNAGKTDAIMAENFKEATGSLADLINNSAKFDALSTKLDAINQTLSNTTTDLVPTKDITTTVK